MRTINVANVGHFSTVNGLHELFGKFGHVLIVSIQPPSAQITYCSKDDAERAHESLQNHEYQGANISLNLVVPSPILEDRESACIFVKIPFSERLLTTIHGAISIYLRYGPDDGKKQFAKERDNKDYEFIFVESSMYHVYFKWRLYSVLLGQNYRVWSTEPFRFSPLAAIWHPPQIPFFEDDTEADIDDVSLEYDSETSSIDESDYGPFPKGPLTKVEKAHFLNMLRKLTAKRDDLENLMGFCILHSDLHQEIVETIVDSIINTDISTKIDKKIIRLYLIHDLLLNCSVSVSQAWMYHETIRRKLLMVFVHFKECLSRIGKINGEVYRVKIFDLISLWSDWNIFPPDFVFALTESLRGSKSKQTAQIIGKKDAQQEPIVDTISREFLQDLSRFIPVAVADNSLLEVDTRILQSQPQNFTFSMNPSKIVDSNSSTPTFQITEHKNDLRESLFDCGVKPTTDQSNTETLQFSPKKFTFSFNPAKNISTGLFPVRVGPMSKNFHSVEKLPVPPKTSVPIQNVLAGRKRIKEKKTDECSEDLDGVEVAGYPDFLKLKGVADLLGGYDDLPSIPVLQASLNVPLKHIVECEKVGLEADLGSVIAVKSAFEEYGEDLDMFAD